MTSDIKSFVRLKIVWDNIDVFAFGFGLGVLSCSLILILARSTP